MKTVSFTEFRRNASALFDRVERGERLRVLRHGKPVATIAPADEDTGQPPTWRRRGLRLDVARGASLARAVLEERHTDD